MDISLDTLPPPQAEQQLQFLHKLQRLLSEGKFSSTYKFALLIAIADLSVIKGDETGNSITIEVSEIAEQFIRIYWKQVVLYPEKEGKGSVLFQNRDRQAAVVNEIRCIYEKNSGSIVRLFKNKEQYKRLVSKVSKIIREMPLWRLQQVGNGVDDFLYENLNQGKQITLRPGVAYSFRQFHENILNMVQGAWVQWVRKEKKNSIFLGESIELGNFLFGGVRKPLSSYVDFLTDLQDSRCFYCKGNMKQQGEVDHFIPWSRYPVDLGHNFVLAHKECNRSKGDFLASGDHLVRWVERNTQYEEELINFFEKNEINHHLSTSFSIACWAYQKTANIGGKLWVSKNQFKLVDEILLKQFICK